MASASASQIKEARVLIVEDDALQARILESALLAADFEVDTSGSGLDALRQMRTGRYDVALVDYQLPEINGLALAKLVGDYMGKIARPVLIAHTSTPDHLNSMERGATSAFDAVVGKKADLSPLLSAIRRCVASGADQATKQQAEAALLLEDWLNYDAEPQRPETEGADPGKPRIILVDDDEVQQLLMASVLEQRGYLVESFSNGLDAIRKIREDCYDLAIIDYHLPELDGLAIGTIVRDLMQEHIRPRMIALTATPTVLKNKEILAGSVFDEVVGKSSSLNGLLCAVDRLLRSSPNPATRRAAAQTLTMEEAAAKRPT